MVAAERGHSDIVDLLLNKEGINVNLKNNEGFTALYNAIMFNNYTKGTFYTIWLDLFGHNRLKRRWKKTGENNMVETLLNQEGIEVNEQYKMLYGEKYIDLNALTIAIILASKSKSNNLTDIDLLLQSNNKSNINSNINVNLEDADRNVALVYAVTANGGSVPIVDLLLKHQNINVNAKDNEGKTALMTAADNGSIDMVNVLLKDTNINFNAQDDRQERKTALMFAVSKTDDDDKNERRYEIVKLLLQQNAKINVNLQDNKGTTALILATKQGSSNMVSLLLKQEDINVDIIDSKEKTALTYAKEYPKITDTKLLETLGDTSAETPTK
jgi:ankyrin repeat protein